MISARHHSASLEFRTTDVHGNRLTNTHEHPPSMRKDGKDYKQA